MKKFILLLGLPLLILVILVLPTLTNITVNEPNLSLISLINK